MLSPAGGPTRESAAPFVREFLRGMKQLGWIEGQNFDIEWRFAAGMAERLPELAAELVRLHGARRTAEIGSGAHIT